jgi:curved DNA-binding protein CbpA
MSDNPFGVLGLPTRAGLTDDDVRAAWRRLAAATHPDRADGGDPTRFAAAAAAYTVLRTRSGRGEALADLTAATPPPGHAASPAAVPRPRPAHPAGPAPRPQPSAAGSPAAGLGTAARTRLRMPTRTLATRLRHGRPARLLLRVLIAAAVSAGAAVVAGLQPATPALIVGAATWLLLTGRHDLAPPR